MPPLVRMTELQRPSQIGPQYVKIIEGTRLDHPILDYQFGMNDIGSYDTRGLG